ncbi:hypothetical protein NP493_162g03014 [Ridgeia piscesae]|uniref:Uncharacterized protein n=1 Tax=Ridgeia piscesae TaxID=27915 RepID=A0AAD9P3T4_RIDPI|nr:hypothetical protein NP493_162g03014 [Ridgeia piscesae]
MATVHSGSEYKNFLEGAELYIILSAGERHATNCDSGTGGHVEPETRASAQPNISNMCFKTTCPKCGKATWSGCGMHKDAVLKDVPEAERCKCKK